MTRRRYELDQYDAAIVDALIDNEHALEEAGKHRDKLEANAFELPDGRKVFKTEDGQRVFNANGAQVSPRRAAVAGDRCCA